MKNRKRIIHVWMIIIMMLSFLVPSQVDAAGATEVVDPNHSTKITFISPHEDLTLTIYKIADIQENSRVTVTDEFSKAPFDKITYLAEDELNALQANTVRRLAYTLTVYLPESDAKPVKENVALGSTKMTTVNDLKPGMYLIVPDMQVRDGEVYEYMPSLFLVPGGLNEDGTWNYESTVQIKSIPPDDPYTEFQSIKVIKVWDDDKDEAGKRPKSIKVHLLADGEKVDTIELNDKNDWKYEKEKLSTDHKWTFMEDQSSIPEGYSVSIEQPEDGNEAKVYTITNTFEPDEPNDPPSTSTNPPHESSTTTRTTGGKLPQTGQLWWPVPVLAIAGILCILIGRFKRLRSEEEE